MTVGTNAVTFFTRRLRGAGSAARARGEKAYLKSELRFWGTGQEPIRAAVRAYEREHIRHVLTTTSGNREEASRRLGIDASTLYRRMRELAI